jgi:drug/metabolite transporter (DMT)-like permease
VSVAEASRRSGVLVGIGWMILSTLLFVGVTGMVRHVGTNLPAVESAFIRYAFGVVILLPVMGTLIRRPPSRQSMKLYIVRGVLHGFAVIFWFFAMARIPIAEVTAIGYIAPIFVTIGAAFYFGERLHARRIFAIAAGLLGTMIILRPGFSEVSVGQLASLASAPLFAISFLMAKRLTRDESPMVIVTMLSVFCTLTLLPGAVLSWVTPSFSEVMWLLLTAITATAGHYTMTRAILSAPLTVTQPISFLQLIWATMLGILVFGEQIDPFVLIGGGFVVAAVTFISHREAVASRGATTPPAAATKV